MFSDPYAGHYDPPPSTGGRPGGDRRHDDDPYRYERRAAEEDDTTVLNFAEGAFDGSPPAGRGPAPRNDPGYGDYPNGDFPNDEYAGGYSYAARDEYGAYEAPGQHENPDRYENPDGYVEYGTRDGYGAQDDYREYDAYDEYTDRAETEPDRPDGRAVPAEVGTTTRRGRRTGAASARKRRGRVVGALAAAMLLLIVVGGGYLAYDRFVGPGAPADFAGPAGPAVVVRVAPGDTAQQIGTEFVDKGVVASSAAFYEAAVQDAGMNALHPGFYQVPTNIPALEAVSALVDPANRVGALVISEGRQLHDIRDVNTGAVRKGIYTLISEASCVEDAGARTCVTYEDLDAAGAGTDLEALGVPVWARDAVANVPDRTRQLEGLIAAGSWDFDPSAEPVEILRTLVSGSADRYEETRITEAAAKVGLTPYELLVAASLVEREALPDDFTKVARVILNRLDIGQMLQFDSTVNYELDETELATTDADRGRVTPWNTYAKVGLPATPISSPSIGALQAVENPEPGRWTYFVTIDDKGTTLFADNYDEHLVNTQLALESGILDSGR